MIVVLFNSVVFISFECGGFIYVYVIDFWVTCELTVAVV